MSKAKTQLLIGCIKDVGGLALHGFQDSQCWNFGHSSGFLKVCDLGCTTWTQKVCRSMVFGLHLVISGFVFLLRAVTLQVGSSTATLV